MGKKKRIICQALVTDQLCCTQVNAKAAGKAAIHCASVAGNIPMLKAILEFKPDLEIEVWTAHADTL